MMKIISAEEKLTETQRILEVVNIEIEANTTEPGAGDADARSVQ